MDEETLEATDELDEFEESEEDENSPDPYDEFYDSLEGEDDEDGEKPKAPPADRLQVTLAQAERRYEKLRGMGEDVRPSEYREFGELMQRLPDLRARVAENEAARAFTKITTEALPGKTLDAEEAAVEAHRNLNKVREEWKKTQVMPTNAFEKRVAQRRVDEAKDATLAAYREAKAHRDEQERREFYDKNEDRYPHLPWQKQAAAFAMENLRTHRKTPAGEQTVQQAQAEFARRMTARAKGENPDETKTETKETAENA